MINADDDLGLRSTEARPRRDPLEDGGSGASTLPRTRTASTRRESEWHTHTQMERTNTHARTHRVNAQTHTHTQSERTNGHTHTQSERTNTHTHTQ